MPPPPLTVMTFNLRNGFAFDGRNSWPWRRRAVAELLRRHDPDLVGLQEVYTFQLRATRRALPGRVAVGTGRTDGRWRGERCSLLSAHRRLTLRTHHTRWYGVRSDRPGRLPGARVPRVATIASYLDRLTGRTVRVVDTHLDERDPGRRAIAAEQLAGWLGSGPTIVLGDLNTPDEPGVFEPLHACGLRGVVPSGRPRPATVHGYHPERPGQQLDHILVSAHFDVLGARVLVERPGGRFPSDHWPLCATLRWR